MDTNKIEELKEKYGFNKASYKYILPGAEILKYIGQTVVLVEFNRDEDGNWSNTFYSVILTEIDNYNPDSMTYTAKYHKLDSEEIESFEMFAEGFSFGNPEEVGYMKRLVPLSVHYMMYEDEVLHYRIMKLFEERDTLSLDELSIFSENNKDSEKFLKYSCNIQAIIKLKDDNFINLRITSLKLTDLGKDNYILTFSNEVDSWSVPVTSGMKEYSISELGTVKLINLKGV